MEQMNPVNLPFEGTQVHALSEGPVHLPGKTAPSAPLSPGYGAGGWLFVSGQVAHDDSGEIYLGEFEREVELTLTNVEAVLAAGGAGWPDVVRVGVYLSNSTLFEPFNRLYAQRLGGHRPARSAIIVDFGHPGVRVEIDCVAYKPPTAEPTA